MPGVTAALLDLTGSIQPGRVLEAGCGTSHWLQVLALARGQVHSARLFGIDLSAGMLAQAQEPDGQYYRIRSRAEVLPFPEKTFDLVFTVNALHHFDPPERFISEARRVLRLDGVLAIIGIDPRRYVGKPGAGGDEWYVYHYFPGTLEKDLARFPAWEVVRAWATQNGFEQAEWRAVERIFHPLKGAQVLDDPFLEKGGTSQLALLSEADYQAGLECIRAAAANENIIFPVDIQFDIFICRAGGGKLE
jgi:SAM-dependent methyltransferase